MELKVFLSTFVVIFLAELGDKTQLATFSFAAGSGSKLSVFMGAACALLLTSLLAVLFGGLVSRLVPETYLKAGAGVLFIFLGIWMVAFPGD
jgi:Ca2+/H+ antiporter, TMEM165/GDT1 family